MVGLSARSTMDLDSTIKGANISIKEVEYIISVILSTPVEDDVIFRVKHISEIMEDLEYPGVRVSMEAKFDGVVSPLKIDISTGDVITPHEIRYSFKLMLDNRSIELLSYNLETVLAEKLETIINRNVTNTRMRDFYDIHILLQFHKENISAPVLQTALTATAKQHGTLAQINLAYEIFNEVEQNPVIKNLWLSYQKKYSYAIDLPWHTVMDSVRTLYQIAYSVYIISDSETLQ